MMQYTTCSKFSLFAQRQGKKNSPNVFEMQNTNSLLYKTKMWKD
jgi:hypothetical protein